MPKNVAVATIKQDDRKPPPLTAVERAAVRRAEADVKAGRLHDHADVAERLRKRATEIVGRAGRAAKRR